MKSTIVKKAVILAGGRGTRMKEEIEGLELDEKSRELAEKGLKGLIPIDEQGKCFLDYSLDRLINSGYEQVCFVVSPEHDDFKKHFIGNKKVKFAIQDKPLGTSDAIYAARDFVGNDNFVVLNGDNLYSEHVLQKLRESNGDVCCCPGYDQEGLIRKSKIDIRRVKKWAVMKTDENWFLKEIEENSEKRENYVVGKKIIISMNVFRFTPEIFVACKNINLSKKGEYEIASALQYGIDKLGMKVKVFYVNEGVFDLTSRTDIKIVREVLKNGR